MKFFAPHINLAVVRRDRGDLVEAVQLDQRALQRDQGENTRAAEPLRGRGMQQPRYCLCSQM
jgi:hypothetical protein